MKQRGSDRLSPEDSTLLGWLSSGVNVWKYERSPMKGLGLEVFHYLCLQLYIYNNCASMLYSYVLLWSLLLLSR